MIDVIVVGSGASAVHAAFPLAENGRKVLMMDVGYRDDHYESIMPAKSFGALRREDNQQHRYFLGDKFEAVSFNKNETAPQLAPARQYVMRNAEMLLPITSDTFFPMQSLARGGLASAWGAGAPPFLEDELRGIGLNYDQLRPHYDRVAARIGISGAVDDDIARFMGSSKNLQPPLNIDENSSVLLNAYMKKRTALNQKGFFMGRPRLAVLSKPLKDRQATQYKDTEFWNDIDGNVYRPHRTIEDLEKFPGFKYQSKVFVIRFEEVADHVVVTYIDQQDGVEKSITAKRLLLCAGTLSTIRIVIRSLGCYGQRIPLVCNPHTYAVLLNWRGLGQPSEQMRYSLAQLCFVSEDQATSSHVNRNIVGHLYSYRSLLLNKLVKEGFFSARNGFKFFRTLAPAISIAIIQHADVPTDKKYVTLSLAPDGKETMEIVYKLQKKEMQMHRNSEDRVINSFRKIGALCLSRVLAPSGASIHYGGTLPLSTDNKNLTTDITGRLCPTKNVFVADGSVFRYLPSKGLTFTMMANADRIGSGLVHR